MDAGSHGSHHRRFIHCLDRHYLKVRKPENRDSICLPYQSGEKEEESVNAADTVQENPKETDTGPAQVYVSPDISREVKDKVKSMSLEEKAAQLFFVTPEDITQVDAATVAGEDTKKAYEQYLWAGSYIFPVISRDRIS